jgi:gluconokinase
VRIDPPTLTPWVAADRPGWEAGAVDVVIGLDVGTTATKAVSVGPDATVRATASVGYPLLVPSPGRAELDPVRLQEAALRSLGDVVGQAHAGGDRVVGICLSAAMHGLVSLAADGTPRGPLVTWADGRAGPEARLLAEGSAGCLHERTGTPVHPMSPLTKLVWWRAHEPADFAATPRWGGVKEITVSALCDAEFLIDLSCASATGMYDITARQWDAEALELTGVRPDQLAEVVPTTHALPGLRRDVARAVGLPPGTPVVMGASDGPLANLGLGAVGEGVAAVSLGTSGAIRAVRASPAVDAARRLFCYALTEDRWVLGGAVNNAGSVVRWATGALGAAAAEDTDAARDAADAALLEEAAAVSPGSDGLLCLPYLLGERAPWWRSGLHGAWIGLRRDHGRGHLVRSAVEGVCQQLALVRLALADAGVAVKEVRATGGALESPVWRSVLAAALDLPVGLAASPEGTGTGAGLLGHHALGGLADLDSVAGLVTVDAGEPPDPQAVAAYAALRPLVERCTEELTDVFAALDASTSTAPPPAHPVLD